LTHPIGFSYAVPMGDMNVLPLTRPLVFFDLETTGTHTVGDRIVEIAAIKLYPDGRRETWTRRVHPGRPIPPESSAIHGITDEDVRDAPRFKDLAGDLANFLEGADLAGYNILRFDLPFLREEFRRAGVPFDSEGRSLIDAQVIFHKKEPRTLEAALRYYCGEEHKDAHSALGDVEATMKVLEAQFGRYRDLPRDMDGLHRFCDQRNPRFVDRWGKLVWNEGEVCLGFGPHRGKSLREVAENDENFLHWILRKDFSAEVKEIVAGALEGRFPSPGDVRARENTVHENGEGGAETAIHEPEKAPTKTTAAPRTGGEEQGSLW